MLVDAHVHLLPDRLGAAIRRFFPPEITARFVYPHDPSAARQALVDAGVGRCWSLPYARRPGSASQLNRWMAATFGGDSVVVPGATLHPGDDVEAVLREALDDLGLGLLKLHCSVGDFDPGDPRLEPLWRRVSTTGHPVVVHAGHAVNGTTSAADVQAIGRVAKRWPEARIIVAHCGAPAVQATLALLRSTPSTYADLTPVVTAAVPLDRAAIHGLERRLLFGSDTPNVAIAVESLVEHVRSLELPASDEAAILGGTASNLLRRS